MTNKYKDFDALLFDLVRCGFSNFTALYCHPRAHTAAFEFVGEDWAKVRQLVGRRLQALRRAGKIVYSAGRWGVCQ